MGRKREPSKRERHLKETQRRLIHELSDEQLDRWLKDTALTPEDDAWWLVREEREARDADLT